MLKLLLGRAGTGKTRALLEAMAAGDGRPQILIVPEQQIGRAAWRGRG